MDTINTNSIDTNSVDKKKKSFLLKLLIALSSIFSIVGVGLVILPNHYNSARAVSYDDENYFITLSGSELNYTYTNLASYFSNLFDDEEYGYEDFDGTEILINDGLVCSYEEADLNNYYFSYFGEVFEYTINNVSTSGYLYVFLTRDTNKFYFEYRYNNGSGTYLDYHVDSLEFESLSPSFYSGLKSAIELDIAANNQPYEPNNFLLDAITLLVSPIVLIATGMGTGISSTISSLIYYNGAMSPFMAVIFIFGGLALAFGLSRWIVNLLGSLGQRNR